ncbi:asparaginase [Mycolicibacterium mucogenicum]|uniref:asparaginase n=1 Tax=Mycolicibacterium mucogenicum TaxID=56689 RepID=UPI00226A3643|nr:asparaginase [Mycolicibacterium mucogenicum]MCX8558636.1 asparaginase [Mycolicibacterium mucogenicum]
MTRVVVIATGGTIATSTDQHRIARPTRSATDLVHGLDTEAQVDTVDLLSVDSSELTPADWDRIAAAVRAAGDADGIVITHGTDTMEETSLWLDITYDGAVPVVLTGAMRSSDAPDADGPANLRDAITVAASASARDLGVLVSMAGQVWQPLGVTKAGHGLLGTAVGSVRDGSFVPDGVKQRPRLGALSAASAPRVDIAAAYAGSDALAMDAFAAAGAGGLVLESLGSGNAGSKVLAGVQRLCAAGVAVAIATRVPGARVTSGYGPGRALLDAGAVSAGGLRAAQARVLLMAALAADTPVADLFAEWV